MEDVDRSGAREVKGGQAEMKYGRRTAVNLYSIAASGYKV